MSYCGAMSTTWTSDYNYRNAMTTLTGRVAAMESAELRQPSLLVTGRVQAGRVAIDSAFEIEAAPTPVEEGGHVLELLAGGRPVAALPFRTLQVASEGPAPELEEHFVVALPFPATLAARVDGLRVLRDGRELARRTSGRAAPAMLEVSAASGGRTHLRWDGAAFPRALIRDAATGEVIGQASGGTAMLEGSGSARALEVLLSDGVRSRRRLVEPR